MSEQTRMSQIIREHWQTHRPQMLAELQSAGRLEAVLELTARHTTDLLHRLLTEAKMPYPAAWEMATREWAFLPTEDLPEPSNSTWNP
jgi:hypothetical protein